MGRFIGTKVVLARPMTRQEYNDYRNWKLPEDENGSDAGYLVEYQDGGKPNHWKHTGCISWLPKEQFDAAYKARPAVEGMAPHQQRVVDEKAELDDKIQKLSGFFQTIIYHNLPPEEKSRLTMQLHFMTSYSEVLGTRIAAF